MTRKVKTERNKIDMKTKQLGNSDLFITPIGFGAWAIGGSGWEFGWGEQDDTQSVGAIHRALSERWSFRRVQSFCRASIATVEPEAVVVEAATRSTPFPLFSDGEELLIRRSDLRNAAPEERTALRLLLTALVEELAS